MMAESGSVLQIAEAVDGRAFQILWVSKEIVRNVVAVLVKLLSVDAYLHCARKERPKQETLSL
jgi:hypothetical protein